MILQPFQLLFVFLNVREDNSLIKLTPSESILKDILPWIDVYFQNSTIYSQFSNEQTYTIIAALFHKISKISSD